MSASKLLPRPSGQPQAPKASSLAYVHLSVDDVIEPLRSLFEDRYSSVWQHPIFGYLLKLHERFGTVFSLYAFYRDSAGEWNLDDADDRHAEEFAVASSWLRFGFHAYDDSSRYGHGGNHERLAAKHYDQVTAALLRMVTPSAFDRAPRAHYYTGSLAAVQKWRDARWGILGLLTADDDRTEVYYLNASQRDAAISEGELFDPAVGLRLFHTDVRLENCPDPVASLKQLPASRSGAHLFTHAPYLEDATVRARLEAVGSWMSSMGITGGFPLDRS